MHDLGPECITCGSVDVVLIDGAYGLLRCMDCEAIFATDDDSSDDRNWQARRTRVGYDDDYDES